jgi:acetoin utilization deacetylase AcuC-like enzyme
MTFLLGYSPRLSVQHGRRMLKGIRRMTAAASESDSGVLAGSTRRPFFPIYYNDVYEVKLPPKHRFPMDKYGKVRKLVQQWLGDLPLDQQGKVNHEFRVSPLSTIDELATTHSRDYIRRFMTGDQSEAEIRNVGFPWSEEGVQRSLSSVGGTVAAACSVCEEWKDHRSGIPPWGAHVAGGTHHAFYDRGEGFCVFSDIAVAANVVLERYPDLVQRILIVDLDVHQGNGNSVLFHDRPEVFTFSIHCQANFFSKKEASDLDIELPEKCTDETYLMTLKHWLTRIRKEAGPFDLIFFQAGVDVLKEDRLGRMSLTPVGVQRRNKLVFEFAEDMNVPMVITMGGGYPRTNDWTPIIVAHANVYFQAHQFLLRTAVTRQVQDSHMG